MLVAAVQGAAEREVAALGAAARGAVARVAAAQEVAGKLVVAEVVPVELEEAGTAGAQVVLEQPAGLEPQGVVVVEPGWGLVVLAWWTEEDADRPGSGVPLPGPVVQPREAVEAGPGPSAVVPVVVEVQLGREGRSGPQVPMVGALERPGPWVAVPGWVLYRQEGPR
jgi:hypothetical protein